MKKRKAEVYKERALGYIEAVMSGERRAGRYERLAVERHVRDLREATERGWYFDERAAKRAMAFFQLLKHYKGEWAGRELELEGWQCFVLWCVFGWMRKGGVRRFNYADVEVARKNGKTTFAAGVALYMMVLDGEQGAEVYSAAVDRDQAKICWEAARRMVEGSPALQQYVDTYTSSIVMEGTASSFKPLSKESKNKDGLNPHCAICDERHAWATDDIFNVLKSGMGARRQPLIFTITTAGFDMESPYYQSRRTMIDILEGVKEQDNEFVMIFCPDKEDDWRDPRAWEKANPNMGVSVSYEYMERELQDALNKGGRTEVNFKTKNCNMWVDAPDVWIPDDVVGANRHGVTDADLEGQPCYGGLDLAAHVDVNALALFFPEQLAVKLFFWIPEGKVKEREDKVDYRRWAEEGWITVTPGDVIDIDYQVADIAGICRRYDVKNLAFDPAKAYHGTIQGLQKAGLDSILDEYGQGIMNMSEPTKRLEALVRERALDLMGNPVLRWMFRNVVLYRDPNDNIKLDKRKSPDKIDGVVALADALGGMMSIEAENGKKRMYAGHGLRTIDFVINDKR